MNLIGVNRTAVESSHFSLDVLKPLLEDKSWDYLIIVTSDYLERKKAESC